MPEQGELAMDEENGDHQLRSSSDNTVVSVSFNDQVESGEWMKTIIMLS